MTASGTSNDGFARSAGGAASRGAVLIGVAIVIGLGLLAWGFDGDDGTSTAAPTDSTTTTTVASGGEGGEATTTTVASGAEGGEATTTAPTGSAPAGARPPGEVKVMAINGTGGSGVAGRGRDKLTAAGYVASAKNASSDQITDSAVYYKADYEEDAKAVAVVMGSPATIIRPAPDNIADLIESEEGKAESAEFHIFVIQGTDGLAGT